MVLTRSVKLEISCTWKQNHLHRLEMAEAGAEDNLENRVTDMIHEIGIPAYQRISLSERCDSYGSERYGCIKCSDKSIISDCCKDASDDGAVWNVQSVTQLKWRGAEEN